MTNSPTGVISANEAYDKAEKQSGAGSELPANAASLVALVLSLDRIASSLSQLEEIAGRVVERIAPAPEDKVGTPFVANLMGCSTVWVAEQARTGQIPTNCIVPGTGHGKPWKFYRCKIDTWLKTR